MQYALADCGGKALVIAGDMPSAGTDLLERRGRSEKHEVKLLKPASPNYKIFGCKLAEKRASDFCRPLLDLQGGLHGYRYADQCDMCGSTVKSR